MTVYALGMGRVGMRLSGMDSVGIQNTLYIDQLIGSPLSISMSILICMAPKSAKSLRGATDRIICF